ncbi:hypothetical protein AAVH_24863 [Aphelenchoides avenae]|nr:hypothetical protein AAVH_24863 [Aphelenchus avenae]
MDGLTGAEKDLELTEPEERAGERFGTMVASSYIKELKIIGVPLTDTLFIPMQRFLGTVNADKVLLYYDDFENLEPNVLAEWIRSLGSISGDDEGNLNVWITVITANLRQEHIDVLLRFNKSAKLACDSAMSRYEAGLNRAKDVYGG